MPFLPVIVTPVAALFAALLESLAGFGEGTAARFAHVARAACLAGLLRKGGRCRGMLGGECERRAKHRHCGRKRRNRDRGGYENSRNLCMCHWPHPLLRCDSIPLAFRQSWLTSTIRPWAREMLRLRFDNDAIRNAIVAMEVVAGPTRSRPPLCRKSCLCASFRLFGIWSCRSSSAHWPSHRLWVISGHRVKPTACLLYPRKRILAGVLLQEAIMSRWK